LCPVGAFFSPFVLGSLATFVLGAGETGIVLECSFSAPCIQSFSHLLYLLLRSYLFFPPPMVTSRAGTLIFFLSPPHESRFYSRYQGPLGTPSGAPVSGCVAFLFPFRFARISFFPLPLELLRRNTIFFPPPPSPQPSCEMIRSVPPFALFLGPRPLLRSADRSSLRVLGIDS